MESTLMEMTEECLARKRARERQRTWLTDKAKSCDSEVCIA